jgi:hypothetical protein
MRYITLENRKISRGLSISVYFKLLQFVISVYFEHEIHETSLTTQKLYEKDNKKFFRMFRVKKKLKQKCQNRQLRLSVY